jgi:hypothetical protein
LLPCDGIDAARLWQSRALRRRHTAAIDTGSVKRGKESMKIHPIAACPPHRRTPAVATSNRNSTAR